MVFNKSHRFCNWTIHLLPGMLVGLPNLIQQRNKSIRKCFHGAVEEVVSLLIRHFRTFPGDSPASEGIHKLFCCQLLSYPRFYLCKVVLYLIRYCIGFQTPQPGMDFDINTWLVLIYFAVRISNQYHHPRAQSCRSRTATTQSPLPFM